MTKSTGNKHTETAQPHWLEWVIGGICTLLVTALFVWIGRDIYRYEVQEAQFDISILSISPAADGYRVSFRINNTSLSTAAQVHVSGDISSFKDTESSDITFDYVASESYETGTLFFKTNPSSGTLTLHVDGYTEP
ncbi:TIGR02588 family protein [Brucella pseudogrignonensis]|uniref:TIGR02588 family protein n=1 Tax=Brucella pseudogrignonensis TaxID=419475 RepID=UPI0028B4EC63|nr:TIGR02588 family protein [Brucella pseudogrignonensis]MDT6942377.1 TIGR02588 family protein [Brucella pseudogrignonensis]